MPPTVTSRWPLTKSHVSAHHSTVKRASIVTGDENRQHHHLAARNRFPNNVTLTIDIARSLIKPHNIAEAKWIEEGITGITSSTAQLFISSTEIERQAVSLPLSAILAAHLKSSKARFGTMTSISRHWPDSYPNTHPSSAASEVVCPSRVVRWADTKLSR